MNVFLITYRVNDDLPVQKWVLETKNSLNEVNEMLKDLGRGTWRVTEPEFHSLDDLLIEANELHRVENKL